MFEKHTAQPESPETKKTEKLKQQRQQKGKSTEYSPPLPPNIKCPLVVILSGREG